MFIPLRRAKKSTNLATRGRGYTGESENYLPPRIACAAELKEVIVAGLRAALLAAGALPSLSPSASVATGAVRTGGCEITGGVALVMAVMYISFWVTRLNFAPCKNASERKIHPTPQT